MRVEVDWRLRQALVGGNAASHRALKLGRRRWEALLVEVHAFVSLLVQGGYGVLYVLYGERFELVLLLLELSVPLLKEHLGGLRLRVATVWGPYGRRRRPIGSSIVANLCNGRSTGGS